MPIRQLTPMSEIDRYTEQQLERLRLVVVRNLAYIGEKCVNAARSTDSYKDQTGNLRSSIGYVIVEDGNIINMSDFAASDKGTDRVTGQKTGKSYIKELAAKFSQGYCLIVVAGMNYASYVSAKGLDVLDSSELLADSLVSKMLKELGFH